jgi:type III secretion protein W
MRARPMSLDRLHNLQPAAIPAVIFAPAPAAAGRIAAVASHAHQETVHLGEALSAALAAVSKPLRQRDVICVASSNSKPLSLQQLLQSMSNHAPIQLNAQRRKLRQQLRDRRSVKELLKASGDNPLRLHLLLSEIADHANENSSEDDTKHAREQLDALAVEYGEEIQSGLRVTPALIRAVKDPDLRDSLRKVYYQHLIKDPSLGNFIEAVLHLCGEKHFLQGLRALQQALAEDIANLAQLPQEGKLRSLMESLGRTGQLNNLVYGCSELAGRMATKNPAMALSGLMLVRQLLRLVSQSMNVRDTQQLTETVGGPSPSIQLAFLNGLRLLLNHMPPALWRDDKIRKTSMRNLQLVIGELGVIERKALPDRRNRL